ncbi:MAG: phytanoyl-CoA dioxygenase family protein [Cyanobacteria bacterium J06639_1]
MPHSLAELTFRDDGLELRRSLLSPSDIKTAIAALTRFSTTLPAHGIRNADVKIPEIAWIARGDRVLTYAETLLGNRPRLVRAIAFDKTPARNWAVTWHQDKTIATRQQAELSGWEPWTVKDGTLHVQPPRFVLDAMATLRIHLDPADLENGCLQAIAGSHVKGILSPEAIARSTRKSRPIACVADAGDAIAMRPLTLHASRKATRPSHRRVLHLEYGSDRVFQPFEFI